MSHPEFIDHAANYRNGFGVQRHGDTVRVDLIYPRSPHNANKIVVGLEDVRAADDIQITYDFDRDGWSIKQASKFRWEITDTVCDPDYQEVAFVKAWAQDTEQD